MFAVMYKETINIMAGESKGVSGQFIKYKLIERHLT